MTHIERTLGALRAMYLDPEHTTGLEVTFALANRASLEVRDGLNVRCIVPLALITVRQMLHVTLYQKGLP